MQTFTCYLVDDEISAIENLQGLLANYCPEMLVAGHSTTVNEAANYLTRHTVDVLFLDIRMQNETGFDLLNQLQGFEGSLIFVTAHDEYGLKAIKFSATDYLLKPVNSTELVTAIEKVHKKKNTLVSQQQIAMLLQSVGNQKIPQQKKIALPDAEEIRYVDIDSIVYCKSTNSYTSFHLSGDIKITVSRPISEYESLLAPYGFIRTHQSYLVNKYKIQAYRKEDGGYLLLEDNTTVPVSRQRKGLLKDLF